MELLISKAAHDLTINFQDNLDIPERFKKGNKVKREDVKKKREFLVDQRFKKNKSAWADTIKCILQHVIDSNQAWRFIKIAPEIPDTSIKSVVQCTDFLDFTDFVIQRRDKDNCECDELGKLCMLHGAFQKEIEDNINR